MAKYIKKVLLSLNLTMNIESLNKNGRWTKSASSYEAILKAKAKDWGTHQKGKRPIANTSIDRRGR